MSNEKVCFRCGSTCNLHRHHIYFGANRKISERDGCWVWLCGIHHNLSNAGVHFDRTFDLELKTACELAWMKRYGKNQEDFLKKYGRNYL